MPICPQLPFTTYRDGVGGYDVVVDRSFADVTFRQRLRHLDGRFDDVGLGLCRAVTTKNNPGILHIDRRGIERAFLVFWSK